MTLLSKVPIVPPQSAIDIRRKAEALLQERFPDLLRRAAPFPVAEFLEFQMHRLLNFEYDVQDLGRGVEATTDCNARIITLDTVTYSGLHYEGGGRVSRSAMSLATLSSMPIS
jgi:hypothetical protein